eukprot:TRINITY_DN2440_c0_g2_i1.p2 TRINITY_DN2440_c0_g2~~TRINITY_DN2440_c0_g2_i1.p2  ORF type:complete len:162 (+),score=37.01 TRINITY_DN2440_c0_g2_i1:109-594(+)
MGQACCTNNDSNAQSEIKADSRPEPKVGASDLPEADVGAPAATGAGAASSEPKITSAPAEPASHASVPESRPLAPNEYAVTLDRSAGEKMGIDVDHKDGETLLIEMVNEGLVKNWNDDPGNTDKVRMGDRIVEVNNIRGDVLQLVDECKKNQILNLRIRKC